MNETLDQHLDPLVALDRCRNEQVRLGIDCARSVRRGALERFRRNAVVDDLDAVRGDLQPRDDPVRRSAAREQNALRAAHAELHQAFQHVNANRVFEAMVVDVHVAERDHGRRRRGGGRQVGGAVE